MKTTIFVILGISLLTVGCIKEDFEPTVGELKKINHIEPTIDRYLEKLDSKKLTKAEAAKILCQDFPKDYTEEYMPVFLRVSTGYTEEMLIRDRDNVVDYYKDVYAITCNQ